MMIVASGFSVPGNSALLQVSTSTPLLEYTASRASEIVSQGETSRNHLSRKVLAIWSLRRPSLRSSLSFVSLKSWNFLRVRSCRVVCSFVLLLVDHLPVCILLGAWSSRFGIVLCQSILQRTSFHTSHSNNRSACAQDVQSNIPKGRCPVGLFVFEDSEAVIRMIKEGRIPNLRDVSSTHRVDLDRLLERINLDHSIFMRHVRSTNKLADRMTTCAFTTIQWKSLMRAFDIHAPPKFDVRRSISESSCSSVSSLPSRTMSNAYSSQRDFECGPWDEKPK